MDVKEIRKLLDAMSQTEVNELTLETGDYKLTVKRGLERVVSVQEPAQPASSAASGEAKTTPEVKASTAPQAAPTPSEATTEPAGSNFVEVIAPIVGTFYEASSPDAEPYVQVGDKVKPGTVLCIIEAMKLMNEIEAETAGTLREILVNNEEPVEYGQVLFRIEPE